MKKTIKMLSLLLALTMMVGMLAACGTDTTKPTGSETETAGTAYGDGVLAVGVRNLFSSTSCFRTNDNRDAQVMHIMYEQLGIFDSEGVLQPWVAKSWVTNDGGFTYDVEIYDYVTDSKGNKITADDIIWNIEENIKRAMKPCFNKIESVEKTGDFTFRIKMSSDMVGAFEAILSDVFVVSKVAFEASPNEFADNIVSTSAYTMTEYTAGSTISFEKRSDYWQKDESLIPDLVRPKVEKISFTTIPEASQMGAALETGKIDIALSMDITAAIQYVNNEKFVNEQFPDNQGWQLFFSGGANSPVANDVKLRQAICYAIDADGLVTGLCQGYGTQMWDVCSPLYIGYNPEWEKEDYYTQDLDKAQQLVAESDYNGQELTILCHSATFNSRLATMIQAYCGEIGVKVKINALDSAAVSAIRFDGTKYDMFINTIGGTYCPDHWSIRYDPNAYAGGDATSRRDTTLGELLYKTWTVSGYTTENINAVHEYIRDNAIAYGLLNPTVFNVWNTNLNVTDKVLYANGGMAIQSSTYTAY